MQRDRQIALEQLFYRDKYTVFHEDTCLGDYRVRILDGCLHEGKKEAIKTLGFKPKTTHGHIAEKDGKQVVKLEVFLEDNRE